MAVAATGDELVPSGGEEVVMDAEPIPSSPVTYDTRNDMLSRDWKFNLQLSRVARLITAEDLEIMKLLISGEDGTPKGTREKIKNGIDLINHLKHRGFLDKYNLLHLQALVWATGNTELHEQLVEFAQNCREQPLHFFAPNTEIDEGQKNVQFHVGGRATSLAEIERLRNIVADYLCVPNSFVIVNGVKPFRSIVITLLVPIKAVGCLFKLSAYQKSGLQEMNIDKIIIGENEVTLTDEKFDKPSDLTENDEILRITAGKAKVEKELERTQNQLLQKERELKNVFEELTTVKMAYQKMKASIPTASMSKAKPRLTLPEKDGASRDHSGAEESLFDDEHVINKESIHAYAMSEFESQSPDHQPKS